ncbi:unnamed protein product, partial [Mesorhabditis spiculigera]
MRKPAKKKKSDHTGTAPTSPKPKRAVPAKAEEAKVKSEQNDKPGLIHRAVGPFKRLVRRFKKTKDANPPVMPPNQVKPKTLSACPGAGQAFSGKNGRTEEATFDAILDGSSTASAPSTPTPPSPKVVMGVANMPVATEVHCILCDKPGIPVEGRLMCATHTIAYYVRPKNILECEQREGCTVFREYVKLTPPQWVSISFGLAVHEAALLSAV